jgi:hypothetical protein
MPEVRVDLKEAIKRVWLPGTVCVTYVSDVTLCREWA